MTAPLRRRGPRPLPLHLMMGLGRGWLALAAMPMPSGSGWPSWSDAWPISKAGRAELARIRARLAELGAEANAAPEAFRAAVLRRLLREDRALLAGIAAYRRHPYGRRLPDPPTLWAEGGSRLLDYGLPGAAPGAVGPPVVFVPSLVNRAYVLDLAEGSSLLRFLAGQGVRPLLLDWGWPGEAERHFTLTDYVAGRLERALTALPGPAVLVGYCMGGLLALAAALRRPDRVSALGLLATPWDFHATPEDAARAAAAGALLPGLEPILQAGGTLPVDVIQTLFAGLDPWGIPRKFRAFGRLEQGSARAGLFVALEDWLNDGVPLAAPVARETLGGWYGANTPARLAWRIAGAAVDPGQARLPTFLAIPRRDRIVPPASAHALAARLPPGAVLHETEAGHIGMAAGSGAEAALWRPLLAWLQGL